MDSPKFLGSTEKISAIPGNANGNLQDDLEDKHKKQHPEDEDMQLNEATCSSTSIETSITKGGHQLRHRVPGPADAWRELSRTPSPSNSKCSTPSKSSKDSHSHRRVQYQSRAGRSFEEMSQEFEEKQNKLIGEANATKKTIDDFAFTGIAKRNVPVGGWAHHFSRKIRTLPLINILLFAFGIIGLVIFGMNYFSGDKQLVKTKKDTFTWKHAQNELRLGVSKLFKGFPSQNMETQVHLISAINSTISVRQPKQPSAIMILVPPLLKESEFSKCFALKFASIVNEIFSRVLNVSVSPVKTLDMPYFNKSGQDITGIHEDLKSYLDRGGKAIVVQDVEKLNILEEILIFHSFCDNFKAHDKRATFFFLVPVPESIYAKYGWNQKYGADISYEVLDLAWKTVITDDSRPAIIARVAATVVLVNEGDSCS